MDKAALDIVYLGTDKAASVTQSLTLVENGTNGTNIAWTSSDLTVIAQNGQVTRPLKTASDKVVTLTATIKKGNTQETKEFKVNVLKDTTFTELESVSVDKAALDIVYLGTDKAASVTQSLTLVENGTNGTTITWVSSQPTVVATTGMVNRPLKTSNDEVVTLTATIKKGNTQETKEFKVNVLKETTFSEAESVSVDKAALDIVYHGTDKAVSVTQDLTLLTSGTNGTNISWVSSDSTVNALTGKVTRPAKTAADKLDTHEIFVPFVPISGRVRFCVTLAALSVPL
nr:immunoglobulin-like domain-containing protein [Paenibacillus sp. N3.4]